MTSQTTSPSLTGFGLIGLLIVAALILALTFGFIHFGSQSEKPESDTAVGTYQPIGTSNTTGQLQAGYQAKKQAENLIQAEQERVTHDIQETQ